MVSLSREVASGQCDRVRCISVWSVIPDVVVLCHNTSSLNESWLRLLPVYQQRFHQCAVGVCEVPIVSYLQDITLDISMHPIASGTEISGTPAKKMMWLFLFFWWLKHFFHVALVCFPDCFLVSVSSRSLLIHPTWDSCSSELRTATHWPSRSWRRWDITRGFTAKWYALID